MITCRVHTFLTFFFTHLSSFIIASVSVDRAIATNLLIYSKIFCKPLMAYRVVLINCIFAFIIDAHYMMFLGYHNELTNDDNSTTFNYTNILNQTSNLKQINLTKSSNAVVTCGSKPKTLYDSFISPYFEWIDLACYAIIPFVLMMICTGLILRLQNHQK
jgi:hypothetical protein